MKVNIVGKKNRGAARRKPGPVGKARKMQAAPLQAKNQPPRKGIKSKKGGKCVADAIDLTPLSESDRGHGT